MKNKCLIGILSFLVIGLGVVVVLFATGVLCCKKTNCACKTDAIELNETKLKEIKDGDFNVLKSFYDSKTSINLLANGRVNFDFDRQLTNITNAIDIETLNDYLYILTKDGNVYQYYLGVTKEATLEATKLEDHKDIKKIVSYATRGKNSGGCNYIITIDKDNNYRAISEFCV